jgi:hypothetical protein
LTIFVRMWGFQLVPVDARPTGSRVASSFFAEGVGDGEASSLLGAGGWKLVGVPIVMGTLLGTQVCCGVATPPPPIPPDSLSRLVLVLAVFHARESEERDYPI